MRILILGGTHEARKLATRLHQSGHDVISSLAGRTDNPTLPDGKVRIGGYGGVDGLADYLNRQKIGLIIDATHPFAVTISQNAVKAAQKTATRIVRFERPPWHAQAGDLWQNVPDLEQAIALLPMKSTVFVTIGRQQLTQFLPRNDLRLIARTIDTPSFPVPHHWQIIQARPPFTLEDEIRLFEARAIDILVTKNAGGDDTKEKLTAARLLQKQVILIDRLPKPNIPTYATQEALIANL